MTILTCSSAGIVSGDLALALLHCGRSVGDISFSRSQPPQHQKAKVQKAPTAVVGQPSISPASASQRSPEEPATAEFEKASFGEKPTSSSSSRSARTTTAERPAVTRQLGRMEYQTIPEISCQDPDAEEALRARRLSGCPTVATQHGGWAAFAEGWAASGPSPRRTPKGAGKKPGPASPGFGLNIEAMLRDIGDEQVNGHRRKMSLKHAGALVHAFALHRRARARR